MLKCHNESLDFAEAVDLSRYLTDNEIRRLREVRAFEREVQRIRKAIKERKIVRAKLSEELGYSKGTLSKNLSDTAIKNRILHWSLLFDVLKYLGLEPDKDLIEKRKEING